MNNYNRLYKLTWTLFLDNELLYKSIDFFSKRNMDSLTDFIHNHDNDCRYIPSFAATYDDYIHDFDIYEYNIKFECKNKEMAFALLKTIGELSNDKDKSKIFANALNTVYNSFEVKDILINGPATIVFWADSTKTVVQCDTEDLYDVEKAVAMCFMKKALGSRSMHKIFNLAEDRKTEYDNQFTRLSLKEMGYCLHDAISTFLNQNSAKPCEGKIITDPDKIAEKIREDRNKDKE